MDNPLTNNEYKVLKYLNGVSTLYNPQTISELSIKLDTLVYVSLSQHQAYIAAESLENHQYIESSIIGYYLTDKGHELFDEEKSRRQFNKFKFIIQLLWPMITAFFAYQLAKH